MYITYSDFRVHEFGGFRVESMRAAADANSCGLSSLAMRFCITSLSVQNVVEEVVGGWGDLGRFVRSMGSSVVGFIVFLLKVARYQGCWDRLWTLLSERMYVRFLYEHDLDWGEGLRLGGWSSHVCQEFFKVKSIEHIYLVFPSVT